MAATTTQGTGPGAVDNILLPIYNGIVKNDNIQVNALDGNLDVTGSITAGGVIQSSAAGQLINTKFTTFTTGTVTCSANSYVNFASVSYTPVSSQSTLFIEYQAPYTINGNGADAFRSKITVNGTEITYRDQTYGTVAGTGTRSSTLFPIAMPYTNTSVTAKTIVVAAEQNGANDTLSVDTNSACLKITEVSR